MIEVVSIKFKNRGKSYFFDPGEFQVKSGDKVIVETSKGLEIADCCYGNHAVDDTAVVQPLRPVIRLATAEDLAVDEANKKRETEAFGICQQKIAEHGLDMKLVEVECSFEGNKIMFFFTSDGRVDFRELVKDLAGIFRSRIELRQIGVRDEAKMVGGIAICGRPYCCSQFLDGFQPVSTKMAKVQSLSLNPTKISGSCGRLMCCLRYEQEAYEDLLKNVPKQGAFVQTKDGYGTAVQVNLLRQTVKVKLDADTDDTLRLYKSNELAAVPGGRPKDGEAPADVFTYVPEEPEEEPEDEWRDLFVEPAVPEAVEVPVSKVHEGQRSRRRGKGAKGEKYDKNEKNPGSVKLPETPAEKEDLPEDAKTEEPEKPVKKNHPYKGKNNRRRKPYDGGKSPVKKEAAPENAERKATVKPVKVEARKDAAEKSAEKPGDKGGEKSAEKPAKNRNNHRRFYHGNKPRKPGNTNTNKE